LQCLTPAYRSLTFDGENLEPARGNPSGSLSNPVGVRRPRNQSASTHQRQAANREQQERDNDLDQRETGASCFGHALRMPFSAAFASLLNDGWNRISPGKQRKGGAAKPLPLSLATRST
jgi:hypothetical protein